MASLTACLLLATVIHSCLGYILEPSVSWPEEYHFNAEEIDLMSGVVKTYEMWYSEQHNRSRIDLYGGVIKRYYYASMFTRNDYIRGKIFMFHPESDDNEDAVVKCELMSLYDDQENFLPDIHEFTYKGEEEYMGKKVTVWTQNKNLRSTVLTENTLYVYQDADGASIPYQHVKKSFNVMSGSVRQHVIYNYYNYDTNVKLETLEADESSCTREYDADYETAMNHLNPSLSTDLEVAFHSYKKHHKKEYVDEEHDFRKHIFETNWKLIVDTNSKNLGYTLTANQFVDQSEEELKYLAATKYSDPIRGTHPFPHTSAEIEAMADNDEIPAEYDLRTEGVISPVSNQAHCGSCWAFAAAATVEGALARANGGRVIDLSEQSLVDCAWSYQSHGCQGSQGIDVVYRYIHKYGLPTVREYGPYLEEDGECHIKNMSEVYNIKGYVAVTPMSPNALRAAIYKYGPVTIGVQVTRSMTMYNNGVFYGMDCSQGRMNHAVTLVGYGLRNEEPYWIVKNSWGESWGESGYILIAAKDNNCNVMTSPVYPLI